MSTSNAPGFNPVLLAPLAQWHEHDEHGHVVQFYAEDEALTESVGSYIGAALEAGDGAVVIATQSHRDQFSKWLTSRGHNVAGAIHRGQFVMLDASETLSAFMRDGLPDPSAFKKLVGDLFERVHKAAKSDSPRLERWFPCCGHEATRGLRSASRNCGTNSASCIPFLSVAHTRSVVLAGTLTVSHS